MKKLTPKEAGALGYVKSKEKLKIAAENLFTLRKEEYYKNPKMCKRCSVIINYERKENIFCSVTCSAIFNNPRTSTSKDKHRPIDTKCLNCDIVIYGVKYCSQTCEHAFHWKEKRNKMVSDGYDSTSNHLHAKRYLIELSEGHCQICGLSEWTGKQMPLVLDHIDGNSTNGLLSNLRVICNNCDALTDTYKGKNRGKGRHSRSQRYRDGKSY